MIIVKMMGGFGNQMFQYAAAYNMGKILNQEVLIDKEEYKSGRARRFMLRFLKPNILKAKNLSWNIRLEYRIKKIITKLYEKTIVGTRHEKPRLIRALNDRGIIVEHSYQPNLIKSSWMKLKKGK